MKILLLYECYWDRPRPSPKINGGPLLNIGTVSPYHYYWSYSLGGDGNYVSTYWPFDGANHQFETMDIG